MRNILRVSVFLIVYLIPTTDANCTFPDGLTGEWVSATRGDLLFNSTSIRNYPTSANLGNIFNFNCMIKKDDLYFLRAEEFINVFGRITRFYLCMEIRRLSDGLMYYYMATEFDRFADDYIFGESENHDDNQAIMEEACNVAQPYSAGTYVTLVRKDTVDNLNYTCPESLFAYFGNLTIVSSTGVTMTSVGSCQGSNAEVCTDRTMIQFNNNCSQPRTLSESGSYNCLHYLVSDGVTYLAVWNNDLNPDETNTYRFSCIAFRKVGNTVYATETPQVCINTTHHTYTETGLSLLWTSITETCPFTVYVPTTTPGPPPDVSFLYYLLIIPAVLLLFWLICLLILLLRLCYVKYGCFCKQIWKRPRKDFNAGHGEKVEKKKFSKNKLKPLLPRELTESHLFKPKRPVDISQYFLNFESGRKPVIEPMSKISPLYQDSIMDYMHGKMARRPSAASVYSFGSIVFDNMGFAYSRALTTSTLVSEVSVVTEENSSEADDTSTSDSVQSSCDSDVASQH